MEQIQGTDQQKTEIINAIDALAYQSQLLALNAAVEAVRAARADAEHAAVAEKIRCLAMQTVAAARSTVATIHMEAPRIQDSAVQGATPDRAVTDLAESTARIAALVGELATVAR